MKIKLYTLHEDTQFGKSTRSFSTQEARDAAALDVVESNSDERFEMMRDFTPGSAEWLEQWNDFTEEEVERQNYFHIDEDVIELPEVSAVLDATALDAAHDALSEALEGEPATMTDEDKQLGEIRDRAVAVCLALNAHHAARLTAKKLAHSDK